MSTPASLSNSSAESPRALHIALWIAQLLLSAAFGMAGFIKTVMPIEALEQQMVWPAAVPELLVRFIGVAELLGAIGVVLPVATRIRPMLTPLAAAGLALIMLLAALFHLTRGEVQALPINLALGGLAAFVAWGRFRKVPVAAR